LDKIALNELQKRRFNGYKGSITSFGTTRCRHNEIAVIRDIEYPEREGAYMIDAVKVPFGMNEFRGGITIGINTRKFIAY